MSASSTDSATPPFRSIAFIGLGGMGCGMAANLLKAQIPLTVWNRSAEPMRELEAKGAKAAANPAECGAADVVFTMLADDDSTRAVFLDGGVLAAMKPGAIHVGCATISVAFSRELEKLHQERGVGYIAAPVLGRVDVAMAGKLNVVAAGADESITRVQPLLDLIGQRTWRFGTDPSQANAVKLSVNLTLACAIEAMSEGAALVQSHGIAPSNFIELITNSLFAGSPAYKGYGGMIAEKKYSPAGFKLSLGHKDVRLAVEAGRANGLPLAFGETLQATFKEAMDAGDGNLDWAALGKHALRRGNME